MLSPTIRSRGFLFELENDLRSPWTRSRGRSGSPVPLSGTTPPQNPLPPVPCPFGLPEDVQVVTGIDLLAGRKMVFSELLYEGQSFPGALSTFEDPGVGILLEFSRSTLVSRRNPNCWLTINLILELPPLLPPFNLG